MKQITYLLFIVLFSIGCKKNEKEETTTTNNTVVPPPVTTPTQVSVAITIYGETTNFIFAQNGFGLQFNSTTMINGDTMLLAPSTSMSNFGIPGTTFSAYVSLQMPYAKIPLTEYNSNPTQAFNDYFADTEVFATPLVGDIFLTMPDGVQWTTWGAGSNGLVNSGDWNMNFVNENNEFAETIRCHGEIVIPMMNQTTSEVTDVSLSYTLKFQEPF